MKYVLHVCREGLMFFPLLFVSCIDTRPNKFPYNFEAVKYNSGSQSRVLLQKWTSSLLLKIIYVLKCHIMAVMYLAMEY